MKNVVIRVTRCKMQQLKLEFCMVTRWLLVRALLQLFDAAFHEVPN